MGAYASAECAEAAAARERLSAAQLSAVEAAFANGRESLDEASFTVRFFHGRCISCPLRL
jgi:hypothetical protein